VKIGPNQKTTKLGTTLRFQVSRKSEDPSKVVFILPSNGQRAKTYRIAPDNLDTYTGSWRLDSKVGCWPWESPVTAHYESPEKAAQALQQQLSRS